MVDIFAGPGGLGEGFAGFGPASHPDQRPFELVASAEMEPSAHATLRLRTFYRSLLRDMGEVPDDYWRFLELSAKQSAVDAADYFGSGRWQKLWDNAERIALNLTLGRKQDNDALFERINEARKDFEEMVLVGGPPCQAYSLVGRARQRNVSGFRTKGDIRHFLYRQYLAILAEHRPAIFIMENVKGILTSKVGGHDMFPIILADLSDPAKAIGTMARRSGPRYTLLPIHVANGESRSEADIALDPGRLVIRCERHGAPQARHRVIIMGVRSDCVGPSVLRTPGLPEIEPPLRIEESLAGLPRLRSGLSRGQDSAERWRDEVDHQRELVVRACRRRYPEVARILHELVPGFKLPRHSCGYDGPAAQWAAHSGKGGPLVLNHETRGHMPSDLGRYLFCAAFAEKHHRSPTRSDFPDALAPDHMNWDTGVFADRFRVQVRGRPSSTITSHLSKDGHAFIHWDPAQCRSLTVREAARLQTFPDDYLFLGNRTQQFVQVGNAVPPAIARQIARVVHDILQGA